MSHFGEALHPDDLSPEHGEEQEPEMPSHTHPCDHCETPVECEGIHERNHDGWPETICSNIHLPGGVTAQTLCEDCQAQQRAAEREPEPPAPIEESPSYRNAMIDSGRGRLLGGRR